MPHPSRSLPTTALLGIILAAYLAAYLLLAEHDQSRARGAGAYYHYRIFRHDFEAVLFIPAAFLESLLLRAFPRPFLTNPDWAADPQALVLQSPNRNVYFGP